jgi:hypothetical protein
VLLDPNHQLALPAQGLLLPNRYNQSALDGSNKWSNLFLLCDSQLLISMYGQVRMTISLFCLTLQRPLLDPNHQLALRAQA